MSKQNHQVLPLTTNIRWKNNMKALQSRFSLKNSSSAVWSRVTWTRTSTNWQSLDNVPVTQSSLSSFQHHVVKSQCLLIKPDKRVSTDSSSSSVIVYRQRSTDWWFQYGVLQSHDQPDGCILHLLLSAGSVGSEFNSIVHEGLKPERLARTAGKTIAWVCNDAGLMIDGLKH